MYEARTQNGVRTLQQQYVAFSCMAFVFAKLSISIVYKSFGYTSVVIMLSEVG